MNKTEQMREMRRAPTIRALAAGTLPALAGVLLGRRREGALAGLAVAVAVGANAAEGARLDRSLRNSEDMSSIAPLLGSDLPRLGNWAIDADFARLVVAELDAGPKLVVELGSGVSTLLISTLLATREAGQLITVEHDTDFAAATSARLQQRGIPATTIVEAPLRGQSFGATTTEWYDAEALTAALPEGPIDLLVIDGPPSTETWSRWPAIEFFLPRLAPEAVILLDDGRRAEETATAMRWAREHPDLRLAWVDTVKGAWRLELRASERLSLLDRSAAHLRRRLNPHPAGFERWPVPR